MAENSSCINTYGYKLRAGQPTLICAEDSEHCECAPGNRTSFVMQSFGTEVITGRTYSATDTLPISVDFIGMSPDGTLESASFNATQYTTLDGHLVWQGTEQLLTTYDEEDIIPGIGIDEVGGLFGGI